MSISARRLLQEPIIHASMNDRVGSNINGPSLIRCPDWVSNPLGTYYLYFAHHRGTYIRMAYADDIQGPWHIHQAGVFDLEQSGFPADLNAEDRLATIDKSFFYAHMASPDVHVMPENCEIRMYYHGLCANGEQMTGLAVSTDGISFSAVPGYLAPAYLRAFSYGQEWYGLTMPGVLHRSDDGLQTFLPCGTLLPENSRHCAVLVDDNNRLHVVWSQVGEAPERLYYGWVDLNKDTADWIVSDQTEIMRPTLQWEGVHEPLMPSAYGAADALVNELRDPCLYLDGGKIKLLYCGGGEAGIGVAELNTF